MHRVVTLSRTAGTALDCVRPIATSSPGTTENECPVSLPVMPVNCVVDDVRVTVNVAPVTSRMHAAAAAAKPFMPNPFHMR
jgi:hypothetical protein